MKKIVLVLFALCIVVGIFLVRPANPNGISAIAGGISNRSFLLIILIVLLGGILGVIYLFRREKYR